MSEEILQQVGTIMRVYVPIEYRKRFVEHFPIGSGDEILPSSQQMGSEYQFVIYVNHYVPRPEQLVYTLTFSARTHRISGKKVRLMYNMFVREETAFLPNNNIINIYDAVS